MIGLIIILIYIRVQYIYQLQIIIHYLLCCILDSSQKKE
nr:MAG TPA: hypothetical protein [Caudoviricetes sp.]